MNNYCAICGEALKGLPFKCRYCGEYFCVDHQLPENHSCQGLDDWKSGKLKNFKKVPKKDIKSKNILKNKFVEFVALLVIIIIAIILLRLISRMIS